MSLLLALQPTLDWLSEYRKNFNRLKSYARDYSNQWYQLPVPLEWNCETQSLEVRQRQRPLPNRSEFDWNTIFFEPEIPPEELFEHRNMGGAVEITPPKMPPKKRKRNYIWLILGEDTLGEIG